MKHNYDSKYKPSIDRINCKKGYTFNNIHFLTWEENHYKQKIDVRFKAKKIYQIKDNKIIAKYPSAKFAADKFGISALTIYRCCNGKQKSAGNYQWKYFE